MAACCLLLTGCGSTGGLTGSAAVPPPATGPTVSPGTPIPSDCGAGDQSANLFADWGPYLIAGMTEEGTLAGYPLQPDVPDAAIGATIVVGSVLAFEPGIENSGVYAVPIYTPVRLEVERVIEGTVEPGTLRFLIEGGRAGCRSVSVDTAPTVAIGSRYVLFLYPSQESGGTPHPETLELRHDAWPVDSRDVVSTVNGPMPLTDLIEAIERVTGISRP